MLPVVLDTGTEDSFMYSSLFKLTKFNLRCLSTSGLIVGDLEHLADTPSSAREEVITFGKDAAEPYGCENHVIL